MVNEKGNMPNKRIILGITGASGGIYVKRAIMFLAERCELHIVATENGGAVFEHECGIALEEFLGRFAAETPASNGGASIIIHENNHMFAPIASGSVETDGMLIMPASMSSIAKIARGISDTLLTRAADVCLKERRRLIVCPREAPYSTVHLKNMTALSENGALIFPLSPSFYSGETTLEAVADSVAGRVLKLLGFDNGMYGKWQGENHTTTQYYSKRLSQS